MKCNQFLYICMEEIKKMKLMTSPISDGIKIAKSKTMVKKYLLSFLLALTCSTTFAQYEFSNRNSDAPVLGLNWGFVGGGFTAMLNNRDDLNADERLNPQFMNFNWAAGAECMYWFQPYFGFGGQLMYWNAGAKYTGLDTLTQVKFSAQTKMTYIKLPLMFYFKSYNRYYPNRRTRFNVCFGPYIALMTGFSDNGTYKDSLGQELSKISVSGDVFESGATGAMTKGKLNGNILNPFDIGFVFGIGGEIRLWKRTVVAFNIRTDVGITNVENTKGLKLKYEGQATDIDFNYWKDLYAKYNSLNAADKAAGIESNRRATKNFSVGAFLTIKKYF
jgi:hypothetical protein